MFTFIEFRSQGATDCSGYFYKDFIPYCDIIFGKG